VAENNCLFCRIIAGEIPGQIIHQDPVCVAVRDINPQAPSHFLIIPRAHLESLNDVSARDEPMIGHLLRVAAKVANAEGLEAPGYRTVINTGEGAGQSVFHLHVHVLGGRALRWPPG